jgi:hypothetical protein
VPKIARNCCVWLPRKLNIVASLTAENLALYRQLLVVKRNQTRPKLKERDRLFWVVMSRALPRAGGLHHRYEWSEAA